MLASRTTRLAIGNLMALNPPLMPGVGFELTVKLIMADFVLDEAVIPADLTFATFTGSTGLEADGTSVQVGIDPATGEQLLTMVEPAGGWRWETTDAVNLPQTIFGFALLSFLDASIVGLAKLDVPITLLGAGEEINIGIVRFRVSLAPLT